MLQRNSANTLGPTFIMVQKIAGPQEESILKRSVVHIERLEYIFSLIFEFKFEFRINSERLAVFSLYAKLCEAEHVPAPYSAHRHETYQSSHLTVGKRENKHILHKCCTVRN